MNTIIKVLIILLILLSSGVNTNSQQAISGVSSKIFFSIGKGEKQVFNVSSIKLSSIGIRVTY
jgi:preprotein translocase subunit SecG